MDRIVYDRMAAHDSTHWWYRARRDILSDYLKRYGGLPAGARILPNGVKKGDLPTKTCAACGRPFAWRKKWARDWENVVYCSDACRKKR